MWLARLVSYLDITKSVADVLLFWNDFSDNFWRRYCTIVYHLWFQVTCCVACSDCRLLFFGCKSGVISVYRTKYNPRKVGLVLDFHSWQHTMSVSTVLCFLAVSVSNNNSDSGTDIKGEIAKSEWDQIKLKFNIICITCAVQYLQQKICPSGIFHFEIKCIMSKLTGPRYYKLMSLPLKDKNNPEILIRRNDCLILHVPVCRSAAEIWNWHPDCVGHVQRK